jgi:hypothetical protein
LKIEITKRANSHAVEACARRNKREVSVSDKMPGKSMMKRAGDHHLVYVSSRPSPVCHSKSNGSTEASSGGAFVKKAVCSWILCVSCAITKCSTQSDAGTAGIGSGW